MTSKLLASTGLLLDIVGVLVLFRYGPPGVPGRMDRAVLRMASLVLSQAEAEELPRMPPPNEWWVFERRSRWGLALLASGFAIQLLAAWL